MRHFFAGFDANVTQTLGMLAAPGAFFVLVFQPLMFHGWDLVGVRYLFISLSMVVIGIVVVAKWDALFPDKADYLILTPLPLQLWTVFAAKATALAMMLALFLIDVNFFATLLWPGIDGGKGVLSILGAHIAATAISGLFAALTMVTLQGLVLTIFSGRTLRSVSALLQTLSDGVAGDAAVSVADHRHELARLRAAGAIRVVLVSRLLVRRSLRASAAGRWKSSAARSWTRGNAGAGMCVDPGSRSFIWWDIGGTPDG